MYLQISFQTTYTSSILHLQLIMLPESSFWKWMLSYSPFLIILSLTEQSYLHVAPYPLSNFTMKIFFSVIKYQRFFPHFLWSSSPLYYSSSWSIIRSQTFLDHLCDFCLFFPLTEKNTKKTIHMRKCWYSLPNEIWTYLIQFQPYLLEFLSSSQKAFLVPKSVTLLCLHFKQLLSSI